MTINNNLFSSLHRLWVRSRHLLRFGLLAILMGVLVVACQGSPEQNLASESSATGTDNCRLVEHDAGKTEICGQPQTVAALSPRVLDPMLALGVQPAAYAESAEVLNLDKFDNPSEQIPHLGEFITTQPINLGDRATPSLEALVEVKPDLIVGETWHKNTQTLSKIAPMLLLNNEIGKDGWSRRLQIIAQAFGREEQAEQVIAEYEQKLAEVKTKLAPVIEAYPLVLPIDPRDGGFHFESYFSDVADLLAEIGFQLVSLEDLSLEKSDDLHPLLSLEALVQLDPDIITVTSWSSSDNFYNPESDEQRRWKETPLLQKMRAVREGRTYFLHGQLWGGSMSGPIAYNLMLDQLPDLLLPLVEEQ